MFSCAADPLSFMSYPVTCVRQPRDRVHGKTPRPGGQPRVGEISCGFLGCGCSHGEISCGFLGYGCSRSPRSLRWCRQRVNPPCGLSHTGNILSRPRHLFSQTFQDLMSSGLCHVLLPDLKEDQKGLAGSSQQPCFCKAPLCE